MSKVRKLMEVASNTFWKVCVLSLLTIGFGERGGDWWWAHFEQASCIYIFGRSRGKIIINVSIELEIILFNSVSSLQKYDIAIPLKNPFYIDKFVYVWAVFSILSSLFQSMINDHKPSQIIWFVDGDHSQLDIHSDRSTCHQQRAITEYKQFTIDPMYRVVYPPDISEVLVTKCGVVRPGLMLRPVAPWPVAAGLHRSNVPHAQLSLPPPPANTELSLSTISIYIICETLWLDQIQMSNVNLW